MRRTIHAHVGPTNSGKTHHALEALSSARSGVYCGPLRLLAFEIHDRLNTGSVPCTLRTGQEVIEVEGADHVSCTVEMTALQTTVEVGVLDEIQMISHPERGWAWSRVLLGLPAEHLHVCGSGDALPLIRSLVAACGDELVEHEYERLTPLKVSPSLDGDLSRVRRGDCVVAFSRREIFGLKQQVEAASGLRCGVVYGSLPPETRREQAKLFNDPTKAEEVLVASDAVGMGLNLNIQRVIFASLSKFDGESVRPLEPTEVKQIAGRAGRYRSLYAAGEVTCLDQRDMPRLRASLGAPLAPLETAGLAPTFDQLQLLDRASRRTLDFADLLRYFEESARLDRRYFCCALEHLVLKAEVIGEVDLPLWERHLLCQAPLDARDALHTHLLHLWARDLSRGGSVKLRYSPPSRPPESHSELQALESYFRALDGFLWLQQRFPNAFAEHADAAHDYRQRSKELIEQALNDGLPAPVAKDGSVPEWKSATPPARAPMQRRRRELPPSSPRSKRKTSRKSVSER